MSHPLPKIFGKKKSARDLAGFHDTDVPLDDDLVPVLAQPAAAAAPTRVISGKKDAGKSEEGKVNRRCMCCDSRVMVPKDLDKFRCMGCTTVNDLKPNDEQRERREGKEKEPQRADTFPGEGSGQSRLVPLTMERTSAIIDRCVLTYLEERCKRFSQQPPKPLSPGLAPPAYLPPPAKEEAIAGVHVKPRKDSQQGKQLTDAPVSSSPPDTPDINELAAKHSATIKDFEDIDFFSYTRTETPPLAQQLTPHGPGPPATGVSVPFASTDPLARRPMPARPNRKPPPPPVAVAQRTPSEKLQPNGNAISNSLPSPRPQMSPRPSHIESKERQRYERVKTIFRPLEDYFLASFGNFESLNTAFSTSRPILRGRTRSESSIKTPPPEPVDGNQPSPFDGFSELDAKTLLLGDLGENSSWWTGKLDRIRSDKATKRKKPGEGPQKPVSSKSPNINAAELATWYDLVHSADDGWQTKAEQINFDDATLSHAGIEGWQNIKDIEEDLAEAREHAIRALFKVTETLLKRPTRPLTEPEHLRWLLIILANPSLYPSYSRPKRAASNARMQPSRTHSDTRNGAPSSPKQLSPQKSPGREGGAQHTGILKRVFGLLAHTSDRCHNYLIAWLSRYDQDSFEQLVDLTASFVTHRISRRASRPRSKSAVNDGGLIPDLTGGAANTSAQLHSAMGLSGSVKNRSKEPDGETDWGSDWQIKAAAKFMSLLFAANNIWQGKPSEYDSARSGVALSATVSPAARARRSGQLLHTSQFYNTLLDYHDLIADFKVWESRRDKFAFCQYPLFLSMGAKIKILEYDARRQMEIKAREAYFDSVIRQRALDGYFHLRVRRDCMVDDSLRQISEAAGAGQGEELKKGLRVHFTGEEGVDAGGPRKEWFLIVVRDIFDPNHGMFVYDEESQSCYFNPNTFETSDQYYLVGALLGLAIYNSTILDVELPPFAFRKLLASAPSSAVSGSNANVASITGTKGQMTYTLKDLAEFRPRLANGLQQLLDFEGDVENTYCWSFVAPVEAYGTIKEIPLIPNGEGTPVTNTNRQEFVDAYVRYLLDSSVTRQFEPFKRGFFTVCAGNALSLFRAEEIELLIRGSDESLNVDSLRAVAVYENWRHPQPPHPMLPNPSETVPVIQWFWELFAEAGAAKQRLLLSFVTGTDRIPAVGATSLVLRIVAGGDGWGGGGREERERFPVARTCFNMLVLWRYGGKGELERKLWRAVEESEGFGLK